MTGGQDLLQRKQRRMKGGACSSGGSGVAVGRVAVLFSTDLDGEINLCTTRITKRQ